MLSALTYHSCPFGFSGNCTGIPTQPTRADLSPAVDFGLALVGRPAGGPWELLHLADGADETNEGMHYVSTETRFDELQLWVIADPGFKPCDSQFNPPERQGEPAALVTFFFDTPY